MKRFLLLFLAAPTAIVTSLLLVTATEPSLAAGKPQAQQDKFCVDTHARLICVKSSQIGKGSTSRAVLLARAEAEARDPDAFINFNEEESDAAAAMFGCDCPACIRSLRQLRIMSQVS